MRAFSSGSLVLGAHTPCRPVTSVPGLGGDHPFLSLPGGGVTSDLTRPQETPRGACEQSAGCPPKYPLSAESVPGVAPATASGHQETTGPLLLSPTHPMGRPGETVPACGIQLLVTSWGSLAASGGPSPPGWTQEPIRTQTCAGSLAPCPRLQVPAEGWLSRPPALRVEGENLVPSRAAKRRAVAWTPDPRLSPNMAHE